MKLYKVTATQTWEYVIEVAEGETPYEVAKKVVECSREYDSKEVEIKVDAEIESAKGLPEGWDINSLPWGEDFERNYTISDILSQG